MEFHETGLPQDPKIEKAFLQVRKMLIQSFGDEGLDFISQPVDKALVIAKAYDPPDVPLVCAMLLSYVQCEDYNWARTDFGGEITDILDKYAAFPAVCGSWEVTADLLRDPSVAEDVRTMYLASVISVAEGLLEFVQNDPDIVSDDAVREQAASCAVLGPACGDKNMRLKKAFDAAMMGLRQKMPSLQAAPLPMPQ